MKAEIKKHFEGHGLVPMERTDLSLYGFTMFTKIGDTDVAYNKIGNRVVLVRIMSKVHIHHINKLSRLGKIIRENRYEAGKEKNKRRADWFRGVHTEVYQRN